MVVVRVMRIRRTDEPASAVDQRRVIEGVICRGS